MATIKSYTDISQSKTLSKILPLESEDMFYYEEPDETYPKNIIDTEYPMVIREGQKHYLEEYGIPCWSLAALLDVLPSSTLDISDLFLYRIRRNDIASEWYDNPVDACYELILKLSELKML